MTKPLRDLADLPDWPRLLWEHEAANYVRESLNTFRRGVGVRWPHPVDAPNGHKRYDRVAIDRAIDALSSNSGGST